MKSIPKTRKEEIMKRIHEAGDSENYETSWEGGVPKSKKKSNVKRGRLSRGKGARFELKVREEMESRGWIMDKWNNNVEFEKDKDKKIIPSTGKFVKAKRKYNPFKKMLVVGTGFPDFVAFKKFGKNYEVIGVEVKMNGILSREEKEKCRWLLDKNIFSEILVVKKGEKRGSLEYVNFVEKWGKN